MRGEILKTESWSQFHQKHHSERFHYSTRNEKFVRQNSRSGGYHKAGFEGGQMPMYRRLPKRGFVSLSKQFDGQVTLTDLQKLGLAEIDLVTLKKSGLVSGLTKSVKIIKTGELSMAITVRGILATAGAKAAVEAAGGKFVEAA